MENYDVAIIGGGSAGLAAEDAGERLYGIDRRLVVHVERGGPVAARERPRDVEQ